jgi:hypothetical protein
MYAVLVSTFFGNMGIFIANMMEDAWQLNGMAEQGLVPRVFARRLKKFDTPIVRAPPVRCMLFLTFIL